MNLRAEILERSSSVRRNTNAARVPGRAPTGGEDSARARLKTSDSGGPSFIIEGPSSDS